MTLTQKVFEPFEDYRIGLASRDKEVISED